MGLANELLGCFIGTPDALATSVALDMQRKQESWIAELRAAGVKASHPDDAWVDRRDNSIEFGYAQFNDGAKEGDLVALGWPAWSSTKSQHRIVRLIEQKSDAFGGVRWQFEEVPA